MLGSGVGPPRPLQWLRNRLKVNADLRPAGKFADRSPV